MSLLLSTSNDVWRLIGSFSLFTRYELTQVFPFVSSLFRVRARELWSKFTQKRLFCVDALLANWRWIQNHSKFIRKLELDLAREIKMTETFPNVGTLTTGDLETIQYFPNVRKVILMDPERYHPRSRPNPVFSLTRRFLQVRYLYLLHSDLAVLECFPNLEHLTLSGLTLRQLSDDIKTCPRLQWLRIVDCLKLHSIDAVKHLDNLQGLTVVRCPELYETSCLYNIDCTYHLHSEDWLFLERAAWKQKKHTHGAQ